MAKFEHGGAGDVADSGGRFDVGGVVVGIVAKLFHQRLIDAVYLVGKEVGEGTIGGVADGFLLVGFSALGSRTPQGSGKQRADGAVVVGSPGVVHAGVDDGEARAAAGVGSLESRMDWNMAEFQRIGMVCATDSRVAPESKSASTARSVERWYIVLSLYSRGFLKTRQTES